MTIVRESKVQEAIEGLKAGKFPSGRRAAKSFDVPETTLRNQYKRRRKTSREMGTDIETVSAAGHVLPPYIIRSHLVGCHAGVKGDEDAQVRFAYSPKG